MGYSEYEHAYRTRSDDELLQLWLRPDDLLPEASAALRDELARRGLLGSERLEEFRKQESEREAEEARNPGSLFLVHPWGIGRKRFGKADVVFDSEKSIERFRTTVFVMLFWLPLFPTGTFRVERKRGFLSGEMLFLERLPLDWEQVLKVWVVSAAVVLALVWILKLLPRLLLH
jgi:hypothetical protein